MHPRGVTPAVRLFGGFGGDGGDVENLVWEYHGVITWQGNLRCTTRSKSQWHVRFRQSLNISRPEKRFRVVYLLEKELRNVEPVDISRLQSKRNGQQPNGIRNLRAMASNLRAMAFNLRAMASNLQAMASNLRRDYV